MASSFGYSFGKSFGDAWGRISLTVFFRLPEGNKKYVRTQTGKRNKTDGSDRNITESEERKENILAVYERLNLNSQREISISGQRLNNQSTSRVTQGNTVRKK